MSGILDRKIFYVALFSFRAFKLSTGALKASEDSVYKSLFAFYEGVRKLYCLSYRSVLSHSVHHGQLVEAHAEQHAFRDTDIRLLQKAVDIVVEQQLVS